MLGIGIWLFRSGKGIEKKLPPDSPGDIVSFPDYKPGWRMWFINHWPAGTRPWPFGRFEYRRYWYQHSTRPLAHLCIFSGLVLVLLSLVSIFNIPIVITQEQFILIVFLFASIILLGLVLTFIFGIMVRSPFIMLAALVPLLVAGYFIFRPFIELFLSK